VNVALRIKDLMVQILM